MAMTQQELKPQPRETPDDDLDEMYEEEPRRRAWGAIASVVLALALVFVGYQWNQAATRAEAVGAQVNGLRAEAEIVAHLVGEIGDAFGGGRRGV